MTVNILTGITSILIIVTCWGVYDHQTRKNKKRQEAETRYKHRNINASKV